MKVLLLKATAWTLALLGTAAASASNQKVTLKEPIPLSSPQSEKRIPTAVPNYSLLVQNTKSVEPVKQKDPVEPKQKVEEKYRFIKDKDIKMAMEDQSSILFNVIVSHPEFDSKDLEKLARNNKQEGWTEFVAMYLPPERVRPEDLEAGNPDLPFYRGVKKNIPFLLTQKDCTKDSIQRAREDQLKLLGELLKRKPTYVDYCYAEENPNTPFAGTIAASPNNEIVNVSYTRSHPNTLYGKNTLMHKDAQKEIFERTIRHHSKKENAGSPEAEILASILTKEQLTQEIKKAVRGELRNTAYGKGAASNKNFWDDIPSLDNPKTRDDVLYMMNNPEDHFSQGVALITEVTDGLKGFSLENERFYKSSSSGCLAANSSYWKNGSNIGRTEDFIFKGNNYKLQMSIRSVANVSYIPSSNMRKALKETAKKDPEATILYSATTNPNYLKPLSEKKLEEELNFALETPGKYAEGIVKSLPTEFLGKLTDQALKNPHRSDLATVVQRSDFYPSREFFRSAKNSPTIMQALSKNPYIGIFTEAN